MAAKKIYGRALHYVFKIGNREASYNFYVKKLGMKILRHEEFHDGCKASCNGPYDGAWSKTMVGYGSEDQHFVLELTYNYGVSSYKLGNDFKGIYIESDDILKNINDTKTITQNGTTYHSLRDPDGHDFFIKGGDKNRPIKKVAINVKNLKESKEFWHSLITMDVIISNDEKCSLSFGNDQCILELCALPSGENLERNTAFGRIAFSCPAEQLKPLETKMKETNANYIHTPYISLDTPGKATVEVVILQDPNQHEICFVGNEAFFELSKVDSKAEELFQKAINAENKWKSTRAK